MFKTFSEDYYCVRTAVCRKDNIKGHSQDHSEIQCFFEPGILDGKNPDPGSEINVADLISESLVNNYLG
jgi:hypothetical protein